MRKEEVVNVRFYTNYNICNYSCTYCIAGQNNKSNIVDKWDSTNYDLIIDNLTKLPFKINIRLGVGGEFFLSKILLAGAKKLSNSENVQSVNLITNLSLSIVEYEKLLNGFNKQKVAIVASYHPTEVEDYTKWIKTAKYMHENFDFAIILVAYPPLLDSLFKIKKELNQLGFIVFVQSFSGHYNGQFYPKSYTEEEKILIKKIIYSRHDYEFFVEEIKPQLCNDGLKSFFVDMSGIVIPCGMGIQYKPMGDLTKSSDIKFNTQPQMCQALSCKCDTENINTVVFEENYIKTTKNQHIYTYRYEEAAKIDSRLDEWTIDYTDKIQK